MSGEGLPVEGDSGKSGIRNDGLRGISWIPSCGRDEVSATHGRYISFSAPGSRYLRYILSADSTNASFCNALSLWKIVGALL